MTAVVGAPVPVGKQMSPDDPQFNDRVEELHAEMSAAIQQLYEGYQQEFYDGTRCWEKRALVIM